MRRLAPLVIAIAFYGLLIPLGLADIDHGPPGWVLPIVTAIGCALPLIVAHECGHLLAALALRLPVAGMRIRFSEASFVRVSPSPSAPALPVRFVLLHLAGPLTDAVLAIALFRYASHGEMPDLARSCVLTVALLSAVMGIGNLLPHRDRSGLHSDGARIGAWIVRPGQQRQALRRVTPNPMTPRVLDETITDADLDAYIDAAADLPHRAVAVFLRWRRTLGLVTGRTEAAVGNFTIGPATAADDEWLGTHVLGPGATPAMLDVIAPMLALIPGLGELHRVTVGGASADPAILARVDKVRRALANRPDNMQRRLVAALGDLLEGRAAQARRRLADVSPSADTGVTWALMLRAVAESTLGDHAQAGRLVDALRRAHAAADPAGDSDPPQVVTEILAALRAAVSPGAGLPAGQ
ncbi:hypothetical protein ACIA5D_48480 [Actinoplanes sp. NPDC051513]|uniref:hypothetical protein n=1 Tax=Actinoplanes sp. NPDC051513 TaxID=3363908 RepID=UPI0037A6786E